MDQSTRSRVTYSTASNGLYGPRWWPGIAPGSGGRGRRPTCRRDTRAPGPEGHDNWTDCPSSGTTRSVPPVLRTSHCRGNSPEHARWRSCPSPSQAWERHRRAAVPPVVRHRSWTPNGILTRRDCCKQNGPRAAPNNTNRLPPCVFRLLHPRWRSRPPAQFRLQQLCSPE